MPEPQEITAVNPTTGKRIRWDGKTWVPVLEPEGGLTKAGRGAALGAFEGAGISPTMHPIEDTLTALKQQAKDIAGFWTMNPEAMKKSVLANPLVAIPRALGTKGLDVARDLSSAVGTEEFDPQGDPTGRVKGAPVDIEKTSEDLTALMTMIATLRGGRRAAEAPLASSEALAVAKGTIEKPVAAIHGYLGGDVRTIERAEAEHVARMEEVKAENIKRQTDIDTKYQNDLTEAERKHQEDVNTAEGTTLQKQATHKIAVEQLKEQHAAKVAKQAEAYKNKVAELHRQHEQEISAFNRPGEETPAGRATAAETKRKALVTQPRSGPVYQRLAGMANKIAEGIPKLAQTVRTAYDARWGAWRQAMVDAQGTPLEGNFTNVQVAVQEAEDSILKGSPENITIFRNILLEGQDPLLVAGAKGFGGRARLAIEGIGEMSEATRGKVMRSLEDAGLDPESGHIPLGDVNLPIDDIRGYVTELQKKMYGGKFPSGDIWKALEHVKNAGEAEIERVIKEKKPTQLPVYNKLKSDWAQFMSDFYDSDGALRKLDKSVNSDARLNILKGAEGARVIDAMGRYARFNPDIESVGRLRSLMKQLSEMPSTAKPPEAPTVPPRPAKPEMKDLPYPPSPEPTPVFKPPVKPTFEPKETTPFNREQFRRETFVRTVKKFKTFGFDDKGAIMAALLEIFHGNLPLALSYPVVKRILGKIMDRQSIEDWVASERGTRKVGPPATSHPSGRPAPNYRPSEKAQTMSAPYKSLGREWETDVFTRLRERYEDILRRARKGDPRVTPEDIREAQARLREMGE